MLTEFISLFEKLLDIVAEYTIYPFFSLLDHTCHLLLLKPMEIAGLPLALRLMVMGMITATLSLAIRRLLGVEEKERRFGEMMAQKEEKRKHIELLEDWKLKNKLYQYSDNEMDEEFNTYIAQRFAQYGLSYLLPIFLALAWLEHHFPQSILMEITGHEYLVALPPNPWNIPGIFLPGLFLASYLLTLAFIAMSKKNIGQKHSDLPASPVFDNPATDRQIDSSKQARGMATGTTYSFINEERA